MTDEQMKELSKKVAKKNDESSKRPRFAGLTCADMCPVCEYFRCRCNG